MFEGSNFIAVAQECNVGTVPGARLTGSIEKVGEPMLEDAFLDVATVARPWLALVSPQGNHSPR